MRSISFALIIVVAAITGSSAADAASLRAQAIVDDNLIRLGDLFNDVGTGADIAVAQAPGPGRRTTFDAATLVEIARTYRIDWRPQSRFDRVVIARAGRVIPKSEIVARLADALKADGMRGDAEVELIGRAVEISVPLNTSASLDIRNLSFDHETGRFAAVIVAGGDTGDTYEQRLAVSGRVHDTAAIPVLRRLIGPGEIIRKNDIETVRLREDQIGRDVITDPQRIIGTTPRQRLRAGEPIRENNTRSPVVVARNSLVTIMLQTGNLTLTAQGRSVDDGAKGDTVRVTNMQSKRVIEAVVSGPDVVTVYTGKHAAVN